MEFGWVTTKELKHIDFSLPADPAFNKAILKGKPVRFPKVYIGCAKWGRSEWVGKLYPEKTPEKKFLDNYVHHYNSIELNATHYKIYAEAALAGWAEKAAGKDFIFAPKLYKGISHYGNLTGKQRMLDDFLRGLLALGEHLGPVFIQVAERFAPTRKQELFDFLATLPTDMSFFLELRHPAWFEPAQARELFKKLKQLKIGTVITDTSARRDCLHMHLTTRKAFIRFVGNSLHPTDYVRIDAWVERMKYWLDNGLKELYFFMHMHDEAKSPELTVYLIDKLNAVCGLELQKPIFLKKSRPKKL